MTTWLPWLLLSVLSTPGGLDTHFDQTDGSLCGDVAGRSASRVADQQGGAPPTLRPAKGRFLIASRDLSDPNFSESVILLLAYDAHGAMGVVVNRPTEVRLASALPDIQELRDRSDHVYLGGPVATNMMLILIRSPAHVKPSELIFADVYATGSVSVLRKALGKGGKTNRLRAYAGHAGWAPGQLDHEIARGDWHLTAADAATVFDTPHAEIWPKLIEHVSGRWTQRPHGEPRCATALPEGRPTCPMDTARKAALSAVSMRRERP
jgi:putative transcriptional regulator